MTAIPKLIANQFVVVELFIPKEWQAPVKLLFALLPSLTTSHAPLTRELGAKPYHEGLLFALWFSSASGIGYHELAVNHSPCNLN